MTRTTRTSHRSPTARSPRPHILPAQSGRAAVVLGVLVLMTSACGAGGGPTGVDVGGPSGGSGGPTSSGKTATSSGKTELHVEVHAGAGVASWTLTCDPPGGNHPAAADACSAIAASPSSLRPVPRGQACTMIYGGPATARITGRWKGEPVDARLNLQNGCEIARWRALAAVLQPYAAQARPGST